MYPAVNNTLPSQACKHSHQPGRLLLIPCPQVAAWPVVLMSLLISGKPWLPVVTHALFTEWHKLRG